MPLPGRRRTTTALASPGLRRWAKPGAGGSRRGGGGALCGVGAGVRPSGRRRPVRRGVRRSGQVAGEGGRRRWPAKVPSPSGVGAAALCERGRRGGGALCVAASGGPGRWPAKVPSPSGPGGGGAGPGEGVCVRVCVGCVRGRGAARGTAVRGRPLTSDGSVGQPSERVLFPTAGRGPSEIALLPTVP
jgi:hypothetical protein